MSQGTKKTTLRDGVQKITGHGCLLVFPLQNRKEPPSLWSAFHPRSAMRWEWDAGGDGRVAELWHLRERLSRSGKVVYAKWFRGRATFFSRELFPAMLKALNPEPGALQRPRVGDDAGRLLESLRESSPQSTKALKQSTGMKGRASESAFQRSLKELWDRLVIVGYGEIDDGAFPSLAMGATELLFEDLWEEAGALSEASALATVRRRLPEGSPFLAHLEKLRAVKAPPGRKRPNVVFHSELSARR